MEKRAFRRIKPIYLMHQKGLFNSEILAVIDGISEIRKLIFELTGINIGFKNFKNWGNSNDDLEPYQGVEWYINIGKQASSRRTQLNVSAIQDVIAREPWKDVYQGGTDHYDVFVVKEDMYAGDNNFVIGEANRLIGTTISTYRFRDLDEQRQYECIKTEVMHELGHVFGAPSEQRTHNIEESLGEHCTNTCVMRQGLLVPQDWIKLTEDRILYEPMCQDCKNDLRQYLTRK